MADGALTLNLDEETARELARRAMALGLTPEAAALKLLTQAMLEDPVAFDGRVDHAANHDLHEPGRPWAEVRREMTARLEEALAKRG